MFSFAHFRYSVTAARNESRANSESAFWQDQYGGDVRLLIEPYTTASGIYTSSTTAAHFYASVVPANTPYLGAAAYNVLTTGSHPGSGMNGLNPLSYYYVNAGYNVPAGTGIPTGTAGVFGYIDTRHARPFGIKNPAVHVGWGYDIYGFPAPNHNYAWTVSGFMAPSSTFGNPKKQFYNPDYAAQPGSGLEVGAMVNPQNYLAGPLDTRWDNQRKVWTFGSVWAGEILQTYVSGVVIVAPSAYYADNVTYDVEFFDGVANRIRLTGVVPVSPRTSINYPFLGYKTIPQMSGDACLLMTCRDKSFPSGSDFYSYRAKIGVWVQELIAAATGC